MNPREKAYDLCSKFMICNSYQAIVRHNAKLCALVAVDEITSALFNDVTSLLFNEHNRKNGTNEKINYWLQVKKEINKL